MPRSANGPCQSRNGSAAHRCALELTKRPDRQARLEIAARAVREERIERVSDLALIAVKERAHLVRVGIVGGDAADALERAQAEC